MFGALRAFCFNVKWLSFIKLILLNIQYARFKQCVLV